MWGSGVSCWLLALEEGAQGWVWDTAAVHWLSPGCGACGAALCSSFPRSIPLAALAGWGGTFLRMLMARIPEFPLCSPQTSGKIHLQPSLSLCFLEKAAGVVFPAEDEFPVLFAAPGCAWGGHRVQSRGSSDGQEPFFQEDKDCKENITFFRLVWHKKTLGRSWRTPGVGKEDGLWELFTFLVFSQVGRHSEGFIEPLALKLRTLQPRKCLFLH